jgi:hypothetical protein
MRVQLTWLCAALCGVLVPVAASAQGIAGNLDELRSIVRPGATVTVTDDMGREFRGEILELSSASISLMADDRVQKLTEDEVQSITRARHADLGAGAKWGAAAGAGFGVGVLALSVHDRCDGQCQAYMIASGLLCGALGTGIGVAVAASITRPQLIYAKPGAPVKVAVAPLVSRDRQGVLVSLRF